jgi:hypothetical protein
MLRNSVLALIGVLAVSCTSASSSETRSVKGQRMTSTALPAIVIDVAEPFRYIGKFPFTIGDIASGERLVFVDADGKNVKRLFVMQFESFLPTSTEIYRYDFSNAMILGGHRFRHNLGRYRTSELRAARPGNEAALTHDFLAARGYTLADDLLMSRFVTLGSEDRKSELILFYIETAKSGAAEGLEERSLASFRVVDR